MNMMTREELKRYAAGSKILDNPQTELKEVMTYTDGALMYFDYLQKKKRDQQQTEITKIEPVELKNDSSRT
jgi:hypothetical protein